MTERRPPVYMARVLCDGSGGRRETPFAKYARGRPPMRDVVPDVGMPEGEQSVRLVQGMKRAPHRASGSRWPCVPATPP